MKLLIDENITWRSIKPLSEFFEEVKHVNQISNSRMSDIEIWNFAKDNGYTILTYDTDFLNLSTLRGIPPKIILLRFGNLQRHLFINKINSKLELIHTFDLSNEIGILEIY
jgi:predicted nuclease of predicted toxin-antitoxin system